MEKPRTRSLPLLAAALSLAACSPGSPPDAGAPAAETAAPAPVALELAPALEAYRWQLEAAVDPAGASITALFPGPENRLGFEFSGGRVGVTGGCNRIGASYQVVDGSSLQIGQAQSTMMACPPPLADVDAAIGRILTGTLQAELQGDAAAPRLRLAAADGSLLEFSGTPTPETRFGGPGTRAFLEVSTEPCDPPAAGCLKVREIQFDEQGIRTGSPGEWRSLPGGIEGYAPTPGEQHIVRVKRFESAAAQGSPPAEHFVMDMVVESRRVP